MEYDEQRASFGLLNQSDKHNFVDFIIQESNHLKHVKNLRQCDDPDELLQCTNAYFDFLKYCLCQCNEKFLISKVEIWFKIMH